MSEPNDGGPAALGPPPLDRRAWTRVGAGVLMLTAIGAVAAWITAASGASRTPVYGNLPASISSTWTWDGRDFAAAPASRIGPSSSVADMAYDRRAGVLVLWDHGCSRLVMGFTGGCAGQVDQTWTWTREAGWTLNRSAASPRAVARGALLYDGLLGHVEYVNGVGQAWIWTGSGWSGITRPGGPRWTDPSSAAGTANSLTVAGYDDARDVLVLASAGATWTWDGRRWTKTAGGLPAAEARSDPRAVYDLGAGRLAYLGSRALWTWDGASWQAHPAPAGSGGTLGYDPLRKVLLVVSEDTAACDRAACSVVLSAWDGSRWTAPDVGLHPAAPLTRSGGGGLPLAFDEAIASMVLFVSAN